MTPPVLDIRNLSAGYSDRAVIHDVTLPLEPATLTAVIGHNGAGKSTLLKAIAGIIPTLRGQILLKGIEITNSTPRARVKLGLGYVPQGNRLFRNLTVADQLRTVARARWDRQRAAREIDVVTSTVSDLPGLMRRRGFELSGGERQLVAYAMGMVLRPDVLLLDEPTLGLAPSTVGSVLSAVRTGGRTSGFASLVVEQRVSDILRICDWCYVLRQGRLTFSGKPSDLDGDVLARVFL